MTSLKFASRIVTWQRHHGRHHLPWQNTRDPYRIWLSEIMLQQTQVATVIDYYVRFLDRFPTIQALAAATQEAVMPYWAGLGYYARARNLHRCAQVIEQHWQGKFPSDVEAIATLPGIGRSTAAAIAAFSAGTRAPILDGNVKRVFTRHFGVVGDTSKRDIEQRLWCLAEAQIAAIPRLDMRAYTQGLMDLGATCCTRSKPDCQHCPIASTCVAQREGRQAELPTPKMRKAIPERQTAMLILQRQGEYLLQQRPASGIWGSLWSLPEFNPAHAPERAVEALGLTPEYTQKLAAFAHTFTHYKLHIQPWWVAVRTAKVCAEDPLSRWVSAAQLSTLALPAPVKKLLLGLITAQTSDTLV